MMSTVRQLEPSWEPRWLTGKLDPLFAGCLPSKPLPVALTGTRQMAQKTTPCLRVHMPIETEPTRSKHDDLVVLLA